MRQVVLFLEPKGTVLEVIRAAKRRGLSVVAVTCDPSLLESTSEPYKSAVPLINQMITVSSWNADDIIVQILSPIVEDKVVGIYHGVDMCALVADRLRMAFGFPGNYYATSSILNKTILRRQLQKLGLSNIDYYPWWATDKWPEWLLDRPYYFKPSYGAFSAYVKRCENWEDFQTAKTAWQLGNKNDPKYISDYVKSTDEYHLEEAVDGELLSVEALSVSGEFHCLGLLSRILYSKDPVIEMGSCFPYAHPLAEEIIDKVKTAHKLLDYRNGPSHTEVIVRADGEVEIIDFNPRFVGADVLQSINLAYGIQFEEVLLDWACGKKPKFTAQTKQYACLQYILPPEPLTFQSITLPESNDVKFKSIFLKQGAKIDSTDRQLDYVGCYLTVADDFETAIEKSRSLRSDIKINDVLEGAF